MIDWQPPAAQETARIRSAIERNRIKRNEQDRKKNKPQQPTTTTNHKGT